MTEEKNNGCIFPSIAGRLGNNMFMIANAYSRAKDSNRELIMLRHQVVHSGQDYSKNIFRKFDFVESYQSAPGDRIIGGYFQSESYFKNYKDVIKELFGPPEEFINRIKNEHPYLFTERVTSIHLRRGDYTHNNSYHPSLSSAYIESCIKLLPVTNKYFIFTDDIKWFKANVNITNGECIYIDGYAPHETIWLMSLCSQFIIANSSFSWWGAYLSKSDDKIILAPEIWYGPNGPKRWQEIYCEGWTIVPAYYENGLILPKNEI